MRFALLGRRLRAQRVAKVIQAPLDFLINPEKFQARSSFRIIPGNLSFQSDLDVPPVKIQLTFLADARAFRVLKFTAVCTDVPNRHIGADRLPRPVQYALQPARVSPCFAVLPHQPRV